MQANPVSSGSPIWNNSRLAGRIIELDGIRGLAILMVLIWHYIYSDLGAVPSGSWQEYCLVPLRLTWSGVDLFFVLSGFLIGGILYDAKNSTNYYRVFYYRRFYRIFPIYFIWLAVFLTGLYVFGSGGGPVIQKIFNRYLPVWSYPFFIQNFLMASRNGFGPTWMGVTWSLAIEEQFYLVLPFLVRTFNYRRLCQLVIFVIVCAPVCRITLWLFGNKIMGPYTLLPCRADALGLGVLVALACRNRDVWTWLESHRKHLCALSCVLGLGTLFLSVWPRGVNLYGVTWLAGFYASILLLVLVQQGTNVNRFFSQRFLTRLGLVAYAVYLSHEGIKALYYAVILGKYPILSNVPSALVSILSLVTVLLLSVVSWQMLERPLIRRAHARYVYLNPVNEVGTPQRSS